MIAQRRFHEFGLTREQLAQIALERPAPTPHATPTPSIATP